MPRPLRVRQFVVAAALTGLLLPAAPATAVPTPSPTTAPTTARPWTVERTNKGWKVTLRLPQPLRPRDDVPVLLADGRRIGLARQSPDGRTLTATTTDVRVTRAAKVEVGWSTDPVAPGNTRRAPDTTTGWGEPTGPVLPQDPGALGRYSVQTRDYDLGDEAVLHPSLDGHRSELRGRLYLPRQAAGRRPVVLFLHGMHDFCYGEQTGPGGPWPCPPGTKPVPNHLGYDAMARTLASRGYVVASISANGVNIWGTQTEDQGHLARGELVLASLDLMRRGAAGTGALAYLRGRLNLNRIGLMGHSRGGEGVVRAAHSNTQRARPYGIRGLFLIAPTDFGRLTVPGVSTAVLLPYCDGDVSNLQGQHYLDDTDFAVRDDPSFRSGILMLGANHNYFNTEWSPGSVSNGGDDWFGEPQAVCGAEHPDRLTVREQRNAGRAYLAGFFRAAIGGERTFLPLFDGSGTRAASAGRAVVRTTYTAPARDRLDVARLDRSVPRRAASGGARLTVCAGMNPVNVDPGSLADPMPTTDARHEACTDRLPPNQASHWSPVQPALAGNPPGTAAGHLRWSAKSGRVRFAVPRRDVRDYDALTMRMSPDPSVPGPVDLTLRVTDRRGRAANVPVSAVSDALTPLPGADDPLPRTQLRTVRVPISRLRGVDLRNIRTVELRTDRTTAGAAYVAGVAFARTSLGRSQPVRQPMLTLAGNPRVREGAAGTTSRANFTIALSRPNRRPVSVEFSAVRDPGEGFPTPAGESVVVPRRTGRVVIPAGRTRRTVSVPVKGNDRFGFDLGFLAGISVPSGAVLGRSGASGLVLDDDPMPTIRLGAAEAREDAGPMRFPVTLSAASDVGVALDARVIEGSARRRDDWTVDSTGEGDPWVFAFLFVGETQAFIDIPLVNDDTAEPTEAFTLEVGEVFNATLVGPSTVSGTILDDD